MDHNRVTILGNVGSDPEIHEGDDYKIAKFSVATNRTWVKNGNREKETQWHKVVCFPKNTSTFIQNNVKKGDRVLVEGRMEYSKYEKDGVTRYSAEVVIAPFDGKIEIQWNRNEDSQGESATPTEAASKGADIDDDIPF